ncbi:MAG: hypothetical protein ACK45H_00420 [Bacteroidota bacterium]
MIDFISKYKWTLIGLLIGAVAGYVYYVFFGCASGCAIKSSPVNMTVYGLLMGGLLFNMIDARVQDKK